MLRHLASGMTLMVGLAVAMPAPVSAQATDAISDLPSGSYELDLSHASLLWKVNHMGLSMYTARFTNFDADVTLDAADLSKSDVSVVIKAASVETDFPFETKDWDKELADDAKWFNSGEYPDITFKATGIEVTGDNTGKIAGNLTMLGQTHPTTLDVTLNGAMKSHPFSKKPVMGFTASGVIDRTRWGMKTFAPMIGKDVELVIQAEFYKAE